jgi:hypothetical protein
MDRMRAAPQKIAKRWTFFQRPKKTRRGVQANAGNEASRIALHSDKNGRALETWS